MVQPRDLVRVSDNIWEIPPTFRNDMRVPARVYASETMLAETLKDQSLEQLVNATTLPGVTQYAIAMPDVHQGYGFPVGGVWLAIIGWFLSNAAIQSYQQLVIHDMLEGVPVTRLMRTSVPAVAPTMSISALIDNYILHSDERAFPVLEGDRPVGLVTLDDVRKVARDVWDTTTVGEIMTPAEQLVVVTPQQDAAAALDKLIQRDVRQVPVMLDGHVIGMVRRRDIVRWLQLQSGAVAG